MWWIKDITSYILNLGARWWQVVKIDNTALNLLGKSATDHGTDDCVGPRFG